MGAAVKRALTCIALALGAYFWAEIAYYFFTHL